MLSRLVLFQLQGNKTAPSDRGHRGGSAEGSCKRDGKTDKRDGKRRGNSMGNSSNAMSSNGDMSHVTAGVGRVLVHRP